MYLMPSILLFVRAVLADDAGAPRAESRRTATVHAGSLLRRPGILEPVHDVVRVQRFSAAARLQGVQLHDVVLYLFARRMLILGEPTLETRQLELRVETGPHPGLVRILKKRRMRRSDRTAAGSDSTTAVGLRTLCVMMMVGSGCYWIHTKTYLLLLQPRFEISLCLFRQVVAASAEGQQGHLQEESAT